MTRGARFFILFLASSLLVMAPSAAWATFPGKAGQIAFMSDLGGDSEIWVINPNGAGESQLTFNSAADLMPSWSPSGRKIAFTSDRDSGSEIYVMNAAGGNPTRITDTAADEYEPSWSPDGKSIVCQRQVGGGDPEIVVMGRDGRGSKVLTRNDVADSAPAWSPRGHKIAFVSGRNGTDHVYIMNPDGTKARRVTPGAISGAYDPNWSPNGKWIIFTMRYLSDPGSDYRVFKAHPDGSHLRPLTAGYDSQYPVFSPDGRHFVHVDDFDTDLELVVRQKDGSNPVQITFNNAIDSQPDWQPS